MYAPLHVITMLVYIIFKQFTSRQGVVILQGVMGFFILFYICSYDWVFQDVSHQTSQSWPAIQRGEQQTRSRSTALRAAIDASSALPSVLMGQPPAPYNTRQHFDDAPALQQVVRETAGASAVGFGRLEQRLRLMEYRIDASDRLMQEVHAMVREMRQDRRPAVSQSASSILPVLSPSPSCHNYYFISPLAITKRILTR